MSNGSDQDSYPVPGCTEVATDKTWHLQSLTTASVACTKSICRTEAQLGCRSGSGNWKLMELAAALSSKHTVRHPCAAVLDPLRPSAIDLF